jgi:hypothetical protein
MIVCNSAVYPDRAAVRRQYPASIIVSVPGGWLSFADRDELNRWLAKR